MATAGIDRYANKNDNNCINITYFKILFFFRFQFLYIWFHSELYESLQLGVPVDC